MLLDSPGESANSKDMCLAVADSTQGGLQEKPKEFKAQSLHQQHPAAESSPSNNPLVLL